MRIKILSLSFIFIFIERSHATVTDSLPGTRTISKVQLTNGSFINGYILEANDSSILLVRKKNWKKQLYGEIEMITAEQISGVTKNFKKGLTAGEGMLIGASSGLLLGFTLGLTHDCRDSSGNKCDFADRLFSTKNFRASLILGSGFGVAGMFAGLFSKKKDKIHFNINGSRANIRNNRIGLTY